MSAGILGLPVSFWLPVGIMAVVAFWGGSQQATVIIRLKDGENLTKPHRRHYYQLLANEKGIAHWKVSVGYGVFQVCLLYTSDAADE